MNDRILFIDFDGTITIEDTLNSVMKICLSEEMFADGVKRMQAGEWKLKQAVRYAFQNISSSHMDNILAYVRGVPMRAGFGEMLDKMQEMNIPVVIISGGLEPYVEEKLEPFKDRIKDIHSIEVDTSGSDIKLITPYEGESDLLEKTEIMKKYSYSEAICIGDGLTDVKMAQSSKMVFARDILADVLRKKNVPFIPWEDFNDVKNCITYNVLL